MLRKLIRFLSSNIYGRYSPHASSGICRKRAQQHKQLRAMSDLELRDLGIGRGEIPALMQAGMPTDTADRWGNRHTMHDTAPLEDGKG